MTPPSAVTLRNVTFAVPSTTAVHRHVRNDGACAEARRVHWDSLSVVPVVVGGGGGLEQDVVETTTCAWADWLPAASRAATANVYAVPQESPV